MTSLRAGIPWFIWCTLVANSAIMTAGLWDISWHRTIGRDTVFTPPHVLLYLGALFACGSCGYLILRTTFASGAAVAHVHIWGFRGPLGAFVAAWGGTAMLTSAVFDNWWHGAYGLDIKVQSPPHLVFITGTFVAMIGALLLAVSQRNREGSSSSRMNPFVLYAGALALTLALQAFMEDTFDHLMHGAHFYLVVAAVVPWILIGVAKASRQRWGATFVAAIYSCIVIALILILPMFRAEPKLGPVLHQVTAFVPPPFPLLIIAPALALDIVLPKVSPLAPWLQAIAGGPAFLLTFVAAQWPFANFLHTPGANNRFFGAQYFPYYQPETSQAYRRLFAATEMSASEFWWGLLLALGIAVVTVRVGLGVGEWLREVRR